MVDFIGSELSAYGDLEGKTVSNTASTSGMGLTVGAATSYNTCYKSFDHACNYGPKTMVKCEACKATAIAQHNKAKTKDTTGKFTAMADERADCESEVGVGGKDITTWSKKQIKKYIECAQGKDAKASEIDITALLQQPTPGPITPGAEAGAGAGAGGAPPTSLITKLLLPLGLGVFALIIIGGIVYFVKRRSVKKAA